MAKRSQHHTASEIDRMIRELRRLRYRWQRQRRETGAHPSRPLDLIFDEVVVHFEAPPC